MRKFFIKEIYDENGILIKEVYNWYNIAITATVIVITVGLVWYLVVNKVDSDNIDSDVEIDIIETQNYCQLLLESWDVNSSNSFIKIGRSYEHVVNRLLEIAIDDPELFNTFEIGYLDNSAIALLQGDYPIASLFLFLFFYRKPKFYKSLIKIL